jgi:hypothetical protein
MKVPSIAETKLSRLLCDKLYSEHVNPQCVQLVNLLGLNVRYGISYGAEVSMDEGCRILDFLPGPVSRIWNSIIRK